MPWPVHAAVGSNTFAIYGQAVEKELTELVPGILPQLGADAMANLRKIAESYQVQQGSAGSLGPGGVAAAEADDDDDDDVPDLVESEEPVSDGACLVWRDGKGREERRIRRKGGW
jgi:nascent polypeptide-associated complex subunit beta